jgi:hypothetical protein
MALQAPFTMTIDPTQDVVDITLGTIVAGPLGSSSGLTGYSVTAGGIYTLSYVSNIHYCGESLLVNKCIVYNTTDDQPGGWFYLLDTGGTPTTIQIGATGTKNTMLYAFVIDITSQDNTGSGIVTVTQIA